ncbi:recombination-associated protein RdgC [Pseudoxanthomonas sp. 22568]|uniref:recombination-associated protein RdgC n=1 Tax=Pseudoxanthomonas sp. 22568 TaxID=3453945 RepID=UPI003F82A0A0
MFFRALTMLRFPPTLDLSQLDALLEEFRLKPIGALELSAHGFVSPFGKGEQALSHRIGNAIWLTVGGEQKLLPPATVNQALEERLESIYAKEGRRPGGRARQRLRDDIVMELLPRALTKPHRTDLLIDLQDGFIAVDTSSRKTAEGVASEIRRALGSFPAVHLNAEVSPRAVMTGWVAGEPLPKGLSLGEDCRLEDAMDGGSKVACYRIDLQSEEIAEHLRAGRQVTRVALVLDDHLSFDLDETLIVHKLKFLDGAIDALSNIEREDLRAELDARFALLAGEVSRLFRVLEGALHLTKGDIA